MIYALIKNGIVENTIIADANFISGISGQWDACVDITATPEVGINWQYDGSNFIPYEMLYAIVNNGIVESLSMIKNDELSTIQGQNQYVVNLTNISPMPEVGWSYDGANFSAP